MPTREEIALEILRKNFSMPFTSDEILEDYAIKTFNTGMYRGTVLNLTIPIAELKKYPKNYVPIECKGSLGQNEVHCTIAYGHWEKLKFTPAEIKAGKVNIIDHLHELLPTQGKYVGIVTYQNGIQNTPDDFFKMGESILKNLMLYRGSPLCIGLYNKSWGFTNDVARVGRSLEGEKSENAFQLYRMISTLIKEISKVKNFAYWLHIAHSEGGLVAKMVLEKLEGEELSFVKKRLITASFGPAAPIPKKLAYRAYNIYSEKDGVTGHYGKMHVNNKSEYNISFVSSRISEGLQPKWLKLLPPQPRIGYQIYQKSKVLVADHDFRGDTYQNALKNNLNIVRIIAEFSNANTK